MVLWLLNLILNLVWKAVILDFGGQLCEYSVFWKLWYCYLVWNAEFDRVTEFVGDPEWISRGLRRLGLNQIPSWCTHNRELRIAITIRPIEVMLQSQPLSAIVTPPSGYCGRNPRSAITEPRYLYTWFHYFHHFLDFELSVRGFKQLSPFLSLGKLQFTNFNYFFPFLTLDSCFNSNLEVEIGDLAQWSKGPKLYFFELSPNSTLFHLNNVLNPIITIFSLISSSKYFQILIFKRIWKILPGKV